jgi:hypothetical protein
VVAQPSSWPSNKTIVAYVDGDESFSPDHMLRRPSVQLVVASFPKEKNQEWIKQAGLNSSVTVLVIKLWKKEELVLTGLVLALLSTFN